MAQVILWNSYAAHNQLLRPIGAHRLSQWLHQNGITCKVIDFCDKLTTSELVQLSTMHVDDTTICVGVSTTFWKTWEQVSRIASKRGVVEKTIEPEWVLRARAQLHETHPNLKWCIGGPGIYTSTLSLSWQVFHGLGEDAFLAFCNEAVGRKIITPTFDITTLTSTFTPHDSILPHEVLPMELARGCQFKCKFCSYPGIGKKKNSYIRNYENIDYELRRNYELFGTTRYSFTEDTVNESEEKITALEQITAKLPFQLEWVGYNRLDLIGTNPNYLSQLPATGLKGAFLGMESLHPAASHAVGKGWNGKHGKRFLTQLMKDWSGINLSASFIVGLPGEPKDSIEDTYKFCLDLGIPWFTFFSLHLDRLNSTSEFGRNFAEYGYQFPNPMQSSFWTTDLWTRDTAHAYTVELNSRPEYVNAVRYEVFTSAGIASVTGWSFDKILQHTRNNLCGFITPELIRSQVHQYYLSQLAVDLSAVNTTSAHNL